LIRLPVRSLRQLVRQISQRRRSIRLLASWIGRSRPIDPADWPTDAPAWPIDPADWPSDALDRRIDPLASTIDPLASPIDPLASPIDPVPISTRGAS
jgi:hypothetical protein